MLNYVVKCIGIMKGLVLPSSWKIMGCPIMQSMEPGGLLVLIKGLSIMRGWNMSGTLCLNFVS